MTEPLVPTSGVTSPQLAPSGLERLAAAAAHASPVVAPLLAPFVLWLGVGVGMGSVFVRRQAMQALLFHALVAVLLTTLWGATWALWSLILIGWPFAVVMTAVSTVASLWALWHMVVATFKAFNGQVYRLPIVGIIER